MVYLKHKFGFEMVTAAAGDYYHQAVTTDKTSLATVATWTVVEDDDEAKTKHVRVGLARLDDDATVTAEKFERWPKHFAVLFNSLINGLFERIYYSQRVTESYVSPDGMDLTTKTKLTRNVTLNDRLKELLALATPEQTYTMGNEAALDYHCARCYNIDWHILATKLLYFLMTDPTDYSLAIQNENAVDYLYILPPTIWLARRTYKAYDVSTIPDDYCGDLDTRASHDVDLVGDIEINNKIFGEDYKEVGTWALQDLMGDGETYRGVDYFLKYLQRLVSFYPAFNCAAVGQGGKDFAYFLSLALGDVYSVTLLRQELCERAPGDIGKLYFLNWMEDKYYTGTMSEFLEAGSLCDLWWSRRLSTGVLSGKYSSETNESHLLPLLDHAFAWRSNYGSKSPGEWTWTDIEGVTEAPRIVCDAVAYMTLGLDTGMDNLRQYAARANALCYAASADAVYQFARFGCFALPMMYGDSSRLKCFVNSYNKTFGVQVIFVPTSDCAIDYKAGTFTVKQIVPSDLDPTTTISYDNELHWSYGETLESQTGQVDITGYGYCSLQPAVEQAINEYGVPQGLDKYIFTRAEPFTLSASKSIYNGIKVRCLYCSMGGILNGRWINQFDMSWDDDESKRTLGKLTITMAGEFPTFPSGESSSDAEQSKTSLDLSGLELYGPHDQTMPGAPKNADGTEGSLIVPFADEYNMTANGGHTKSYALRKTKLIVAQKEATAANLMTSLSDHKDSCEASLFRAAKEYLDPAGDIRKSMTVETEENLKARITEYPKNVANTLETHGLDEVIKVDNVISELAWAGFPGENLSIYFVEEDFTTTDGSCTYHAGDILAYIRGSGVTSASCFDIDETAGTATLINDGYPSSVGINARCGFDSEFALTISQMGGAAEYGWSAKSTLTYLLGAFKWSWRNICTEDDSGSD